MWSITCYLTHRARRTRDRELTSLSIHYHFTGTASCIPMVSLKAKLNLKTVMFSLLTGSTLFIIIYAILIYKTRYIGPLSQSQHAKSIKLAGTGTSNDPTGFATRTTSLHPMSVTSKLNTRKYIVVSSLRKVTKKPTKKPMKKPTKKPKGLLRPTDDMVLVQKYCTPETCLKPEDLSSNEDHKFHMKCTKMAITLLQKSLQSTNVSLSRCSCHLRRGETKYRRVGLVSLPGSGNTWVRGLLERATKICTGSMWCDPNLRAIHFCGEGLRSMKGLVTKNHDPTIRWRGQALKLSPLLSVYNKPEFDAAIFVDRNPFDSIVAEHNRELGFLLWEAAVKKGNFVGRSFSQHVQYFGKEFFSEFFIDYWGML